VCERLDADQRVDRLVAREHGGPGGLDRRQVLEPQAGDTSRVPVATMTWV
jgi:hypothetical protein